MPRSYEDPVVLVREELGEKLHHERLQLIPSVPDYCYHVYGCRCRVRKRGYECFYLPVVNRCH